MVVYDSWEEREKAETKMILKQKLEDNTLTYEELTKKSNELEKEYSELKDRLDEIEHECIQVEYLRMLLLMQEGL